MPADGAVANSIAISGRFLFFVTYDSKISPLFEGDYDAGLNIFKELDAFCRPVTVYADAELAFWYSMDKRTGPNWQDFVAKEDRFFINRALAAAKRLETLKSVCSPEWAIENRRRSSAANYGRLGKI